MKSKIRPAYIIAILLVGGVLVWLVSLVPSEQKPDVPPTAMVGKDEPTENLSSSKMGVPAQRQVNTDRSNSIGNSSAIFDRPEVPLDYFHQLNKVFSWPIEFYGKVIDDQGNPVSGAEAHVSWAISPLEHGPSKAVKMTDATGSFEITGERGRSLSVIISKRGYYFPKGQRTSFGYAPEEGATSRLIKTIRSSSASASEVLEWTWLLHSTALIPLWAFIHRMTVRRFVGGFLRAQNRWQRSDADQQIDACAQSRWCS